MSEGFIPDNNPRIETENDSRDLDNNNYDKKDETLLSEKWKLYNIIWLGLTFMLLFTSFQTCAMVQTLVLEGSNNQTNQSSGNGYTSLSIIYASFALSNWLAPPIVSCLTAKWSMFAAGLTYCIFIGLFLKPFEATLYFSSFLVGFGAAVLWTAHGEFLSNNSNQKDMTRNTSIYWAMQQMSLIWGNLYVYFQFNGLVFIDSVTRTRLFTILSIISSVGVFLMIFFKNEPKSLNKIRSRPMQIFRYCLKLSLNKQMVLLYLIFVYSGMELSFWSVFITCVGHLKYFSIQSKQLTGVCGLFIGIGQICGSLLFSILGKPKLLNRSLVIVIGFFAHSLFITLVFLSFPPLSPISETNELAFILPNKLLVFGCAFLLGFGDSCFITQIYPTLKEFFPDQMSSASALFKFTQSLASALAFVYSQHLLLPFQLLILFAFLFFGLILFFVSDKIQSLKQISV